MGQLVDRLIEQMREELQLQQGLVTVLENRLDAMRHYDLSRLETLDMSQQRLIDTLQLAAGNRGRTAYRLTRELMPKYRGRSATVSELAQMIDQPNRDELMEVAELLRQTAQNSQRLNRINNSASNKIIGHLDRIFHIVAEAGRDIGLYSRVGKKPTFLEQNRIVDATA